MFGFGSMLKDYLDFYKISQTDFADRLGISKKHMNEILSGKTNISEELMLGISLITDIDVNLIFYVESKKRIYDYLNDRFKNEKKINEFLKGFFLEEMSDKEWIKLKDKNSYVQNAIDLLDYLGISSFDNVDNYVDRRILYKKKKEANLNKVYLWIRRCDSLAIKQHVSEYNSNDLLALLDELKTLRMEEYNEEKLIKLFNKYGIYLVIEEALKGTKIRGCTLVKDKNPCIYLTRYFRDKASLYFTLYHEIGHVKSDYNKAKSKIIVNEEGKQEKKMDIFSLNEMIPLSIWKQIIDNLNNAEEICNENSIPLSFLYSRLAYEGIISYSSKEYNDHKEKI